MNAFRVVQAKTKLLVKYLSKIRRPLLCKYVRYYFVIKLRVFDDTPLFA